VNMHWIERLSDYQDGELAPADRTACEAHLAECAMCRTALDELRVVIAAAKADPDVMPSTDLWPAIVSRTDAAKRGSRLWGRASTRPTRISFTLPQLALAASLLIAVSAAVAYFAAGRGAVINQPTAAEQPIQAMAEPVIPPSPDVAPANFADAQYDRAISDLERILLEQRDELDPRTVMVIERNLAAIDNAIRQARAALDADPANPFLNSHLAEARRRKLDLLRHATTLNSAGD
jgi:anti-sigma factor RsiW